MNNDNDRPSYRPMYLSDDDLGVYAERGGRFDDDLSLGGYARDGVRWSGTVRLSPYFGDRIARAMSAAGCAASAATIVGSANCDAPLTSRLARSLESSGVRCAHCDTAFTPRRSTARFCSASCRVASSRSAR